jgi:hypothetical protein
MEGSQSSEPHLNVHDYEFFLPLHSASNLARS